MSTEQAAPKSPSMKLMKKAPTAAAPEVAEPIQATDVAETTKIKQDTEIQGAESLVKGPEDVISSTVQEIKGMKAEKAFSMVPKLLDNIDHDYFKLGGILSAIQSEGWFMEHAFENFKAYVESECGIQYRKAIYLIQIYNGLVASGVKWEDVKHLGWTKLKELSSILTPDNVGEWVGLAEGMTVLQLQEHIKSATAAPNSDAKPDDDAEAKQVTTMTFKLHTDQKETVREALDKAKHEVGTEFDAVALESIALNFLGGESKLQSVPTLAELMKGKSAEEVLGIFGEVFPDVELSATLPE